MQKLKRNKLYIFNGTLVKIIDVARISTGFIVTYQQDACNYSKGKVHVISLIEDEYSHDFREPTPVEKVLF
jgi:hypothetical protein